MRHRKPCAAGLFLLRYAIGGREAEPLTEVTYALWQQLFYQRHRYDNDDDKSPLFTLRYRKPCMTGLYFTIHHQRMRGRTSHKGLHARWQWRDKEDTWTIIYLPYPLHIWFRCPWWPIFFNKFLIFYMYSTISYCVVPYTISRRTWDELHRTRVY